VHFVTSTLKVRRIINCGVIGCSFFLSFLLRPLCAPLGVPLPWSWVSCVNLCSCTSRTHFNKSRRTGETEWRGVGKVKFTCWKVMTNHLLRKEQEKIFSCTGIRFLLVKFSTSTSLVLPWRTVSFSTILLYCNFFFLVGWDLRHQVLRPLLAYCTAQNDIWGWLWSNWWNEDWQGKPKYSEKTWPSAILSTTNPTWPDPCANPGRRGGKPATNRLSYGAASIVT
jgi:hypothetical protein